MLFQKITLSYHEWNPPSHPKDHKGLFSLATLLKKITYLHPTPENHQPKDIMNNFDHAQNMPRIGTKSMTNLHYTVQVTVTPHSNDSILGVG